MISKVNQQRYNIMLDAILHLKSFDIEKTNHVTCLMSHEIHVGWVTGLTSKDAISCNIMLDALLHFESFNIEKTNNVTCLMSHEIRVGWMTGLTLSLRLLLHRLSTLCYEVHELVT